MIDYIIYSEFDINEGSLVKIEYPNKTGISEMTLSSCMIPEGIHNTMKDTFCFIINRNNEGDESIIKEIKRTQNELTKIRTIKYLDFQFSMFYQNNIKDKYFLLKEIYNFNSLSNNWETLKTIQPLIQENKQIFLKITQNEKEKFYKLIIFTFNNNEDINNIDINFEIQIHSDIQFQKLKPNFASIYTVDSKAIGFEFISSDDLLKFEELFNDPNLKEIYCSTEENHTNNLFKNSTNIINKDKDIYFLCLAQTILDKSTKRGAILKSIAVGTTKLINLNCFQNTCEYLIGRAFEIHNSSLSPNEKIKKMREDIRKTLEAFNNLKFNFGMNLSRFERIVYAYLNGNNYFTLPTTTNEDTLNIDTNGIIKIDLRLSDNEEKIFPGSIIELIKIFGEYIMTIYDGILNDQKIIFLGGTSTSCKQLSSLIFGCLSMVGPLSFGLIKRLHPYRNLYDLNFLNINNCIYGVTNPIFKSKTKYWDILCEVETGKIAISEKYNEISSNINKESDLLFIKELIYKINNESLTEFEVEQYFTYYTLHLFKISKEQYFAEDEVINNEINRQWKRKIKMNNANIYKIENEYEKFRSLISYNNTSFEVLERHINNLLTRKNIEKEELNMIYSDIENFILGGAFYVQLFLGLIIFYSYDFEIVFNGIFCKHPEIRQKVKNIYNILGNDILGNLLLRKLNYVYLIKLNEVDYNSLIENEN